MTVVETALTFVAAPAAVVAGAAALVYATSSLGSKRYRPGRPFTFSPVWFLAAPDQQLDEARQRPALLAAAAGLDVPKVKGGARGTW